MLHFVAAILAATTVDAIPLLEHQLLPRVEQAWQPWYGSSSSASTGGSSGIPTKTSVVSTTSGKLTTSGASVSSPAKTSVSPTVSVGGSKSSAISSAASTGAASQQDACAVVSAASASYLSAFPKATYAVVNVSDAVDCLNSIPIVTEDATQLLASLRTYIEFQSDHEYLKYPPDGYTNPPFDLDGALDQIQDNIDSGAYQSEIEFQVDIYDAISQTYDGHFSWAGDILRGVFSFRVQTGGLASVSADGIADPKIYFTSDLLTSSDGVTIELQTGYKASPVTKLNGMDIVEALETLALFVPSQDPDARYNSLLWILGRIQGPGGAFPAIRQPPQDVTSYDFVFANGSTLSVPITATVIGDFTDVTDGVSAYETFALFNDLYNEGDEDTDSGNATATSSMSSTTTSMTAASSAPATATAAAPPNIPGFPYPVVKDAANLIAGYYLNETGFEDVAVLQITGFLPEVPTDTYLEDFQDALSYFLTRAKSDSKTKLIIDVQGNGGGSIDLGTDTFAQLFPNVEPNQSGNIRRSAGMDVIIETATNLTTEMPQNATAEDILSNQLSPFDVEYDVTPDNVNIETIDQFLDGISYHGREFTAFFQTNYTDPFAYLSTDFNITPTNLNAKPVFAPENVVLLTDGLCASSCTVFAERLKNLVGGIPFILAGGRPQQGPVQAVGGIKGSQIFSFNTIGAQMLPVYQEASDELLAPLNGTEWDYFNVYALARTSAAVQAGSISGGASAEAGGVNGRNSFRIGDVTDTPLQYVYEAADCRIWYTPEMLYNATALWNRVAEVAFTKRTGLAYTSKYCSAGSTGNPTAVTGGWKKGTLGPQGQGLIERASPIFNNAPWAGGYRRNK